MAVNAAALLRGPNGHARAEGLSAIVAARTKRCRDVLRAVVNRVWISWMRRRNYRRNRRHVSPIRPAAESLMIYARGNTASLAWCPIVAVIVSE